MNSEEIIQGPQVLTVLRTVCRKRTLVRMNLANPPASVLTLLVEVRNAAAPPLFLVDVMEEMTTALAEAASNAVDFEFTGAEGVLYRFRTRGGQLASEGLWLPVPETMERIQRRKDFRLTVLPGTRILYETDTARGTIRVIDISLGGSLGTLIRLRADSRAGNLFREGGELSNLHLEIPVGEEVRHVRIRKARIRRVHQAPGAVRPRCGLAFEEIAPDQKKALIEAVYTLQRTYLKNRRRG